MKDRRGAGFPFSIGCMSQSAVAVAGPLEKKQQLQPADPPSSSPTTATQGRRSITRRPIISEKGAGEEAGCGVSEEEKAKAAAAAAAASGVVAAGVHRLIKGIKNMSQMFALYDNGEDEEEEEEREIVIGYPTDVQHIGHIGWDGTNKVVGMGMASAFSLPSSLSLHHLEIAMDAGATCTN
uniref:Uncharacterized protein n=1 Tax=Avena sativa TaxID=4498 RepID=A0ACD6ABX0_AVESA